MRTVVVVTVMGMDMNRWESQLRKGVVELAVLAEIAKGETYGYEIVERLRLMQGLEFTESTIYPVLTRLAREGALEVRTEASPSGPTRRYYRLSGAGQQRFRTFAESWKSLSQSLTHLIEGAVG